MGFVNKEDGQFNKHQWNWPEGIPGTTPKKAFHIETKDEIDRKKYTQLSLPAQSESPYYTPEQRSGDESKLRSSAVSVEKPTPLPSLTRRKRYDNLRLCEANMVMYLNSLKMSLFDTNNPAIQNLLALYPSVTDEQLGSMYDDMVNSYNKNSFDPAAETLVDGNNQSYEKEYNTINQSKSSPVMPSKDDFIATYRKTGTAALISDLLTKRGYHG